jgi:hypothetical protein
LNILRLSIISSVLFLAFGTVSSGLAERTPLNPEEARHVVARAQDDIKKASQFAHNNGKQQRRFDNALHSLSELDRSYSNDRYNKGRLVDAIRDVGRVMDDNTISPQDRDALHRDLEDLRFLRAAAD